VGEIVLSDHLANGAGFVAWISAEWRRLAERLARPDEPQNTFVGALTGPSHRASCDSAGYDCIKQYRNMTYHGLLDWRLGLSVLRLLRSAQTVIGLDGRFDDPELVGWQDFATGRRDAFCESFGGRPLTYGTLPGFE